MMAPGNFWSTKMYDFCPTQRILFTKKTDKNKFEAFLIKYLGLFKNDTLENYLFAACNYTHFHAKCDSCHFGRWLCFSSFFNERYYLYLVYFDMTLK